MFLIMAFKFKLFESLTLINLQTWLFLVSKLMFNFIEQDG